MRFLYHCFTFVYVVPLTVAAFFRSLLRGSGDWQRLALRLPPQARRSHPLWLVASSVGEVTIALKLTARLKSRTKRPVLLSVTTATGKRHAEGAAVRPDFICYHPFDLRRVTSSYLRYFRPRGVILIETELWPVLLEAALEQAVAVAQVSGRISEKSVHRYRALKPIFVPLLQECKAFWMQSAQDAERIVELGARAERVEVVGSIKEDYQPPEASLMHEVDERVGAWRGKRLCVCGSTRPGEEAVLIEAFQTLRCQYADLRLVLVPRHLDRLGEVNDVVARSGLRCQWWTKGILQADDEILIVDTMGKLNALYHRATTAFVGGTLAPIGGHNLLEPALAGVPVFYGPHYFQQQRGHELLQDQRMGTVVASAAELAGAVQALLASDAPGAEYGRRAEALRAASAHVLDDYVSRILNLIEDHE